MILSVVVCALGLVGIGFAGSSRQIAAGVEIAGIDVGGLTPAQAKQKLERASQKLSWTAVDFLAAGKSFRVAPAQLGVELDWDAAIASARREGEGFSLLRGFKRLEMRFEHVRVTPPVRHSALALNHFLAQIARSVNRPALEPALVLDGAQPTIVSGHSGRALRRQAAGNLIVNVLSSPARVPVNLPVKTIVPKVRRADLVRVEDQIQTAVSAPVFINLGAVRWEIAPAQIKKMLAYPHGGQKHLTIAGAKATSYMKILSRQLDRPARDATFAVSGESIHLVPSRPGREVDRKRTAASILYAALSPTDRTASVVMKTARPKRTTAQARAMGITGVVGHYETSFTGTANRISNVELVAKLLDGKYIGPGAVFSFNRTTGQRDAKKGFLPAPVIINGEVSEGLGGGVCQVSTTVFNAAFEAGLKILERTNHALYISHYPLGRDATVNWPGTDLKFKNDTGHWLLMRTFSSSDTLLVVLYGTPQHRKVVSKADPLHVIGSPPVKTTVDPALPPGARVVDDVGQPASYTTVYRKVYAPSGKLLYDDTFHSSYRSSPEIVRIGPKKKPAKKPKTDTTQTATTTTGASTTGATTGNSTTTTAPPPGEPVTTG